MMVMSVGRNGVFHIGQDFSTGLDIRQGGFWMKSKYLPRNVISMLKINYDIIPKTRRSGWFHRDLKLTTSLFRCDEKETSSLL